MPPTYEKQQLDRLVQQTDENHKILKSLRNHARWAAFFGTIKWAIIIVPIVLAYVYFQPYLESRKNDSKSILESVKDVRGFGGDFKDLICGQESGKATTSPSGDLPACTVY